MTEHPSRVLRRLEQRARRRFGQNFLVDPRITARIAGLCRVGEGDRVVEIGPGLGALSRALLDTGAQVRAVELDRDLVAFLAEELPALDVVAGDALKVSWEEVAPGEGWVVASNLPYNVGTAIVTRLVTGAPRFRRLVVMLQREVALRMTAEVGERARGSLSVHVQAYARPSRAFTVEPGSFHPRPKVRSSVIAIDLREEPLLGGASPAAFERTVRAGFSQRRKTLENALSSSFDRERARAVVADTVGAGRRAQTLEVSEWGALAAALEVSRGGSRGTAAPSRNDRDGVP